MMPQPKPAYIPWRDRVFVTVNEAAEILARSPDWVRHKIADGKLRAGRYDKGGPLIIFTGSVAALADGVEPAHPQAIRGAPIYLAVDNTPN